MNFYPSRGKTRHALLIIASVLGAVTLSAAFAGAVTTIDTNINTGGTLTVSGAAAASSTLQVTGAVTTYGSLTLGDAVADSVTANAYFTQLRIGTGSTFGHIGTVGSDELGVEGDVEIDGIAWFDGVLQASSTALFGSGGTFYSDITLQNAETISNSTDGTITLTATNLKFVGTASTSAIRVGDEPAAPAINGLVHGYCTIADISIVTASSTIYTDCTSSVTGALTTSDRIFVQATSSMPAPIVVQAASSTGVSTINIRLDNRGATPAAGPVSLNFWAVRP